MDAKQNAYEIAMECFETFKAQNPDDFDVVFGIEGKKLYTDKYKLIKISPTLKSMLSERWSKKDEPVKIENYKFQDFKEFLTFIYSGECSLNDENIFSMVDIAEFYGVKVFKKTCDQYLSTMEFTLQNVFELLEFANKYSLLDMKKSLNVYISKNFAAFIKSEHFQSISDSVIKGIVEAHQDTLRLEEFFEAVYKWAEFRALKKQKSSGKTNRMIKKELSKFLPVFKFENMDAEFLIKFVVKKSFLFSGDKLSDILWSARGKVYVKVFDENGKIMKGVLNCPENEKFGDAIESQKGESLRYGTVYTYSSEYYWSTNLSKPSASSKLTKRDNIEWYLTCASSKLIVQNRKNIDYNYYLLAEMLAEDGFQLSTNCKIEVYRYA